MLDVAPAFGLFVPQQDSRMTDGERAALVRLLEETGAEFVAAVEQLEPVAWEYKPRSDRWSIGQIAEHVLMSENSLFAAMRRALATRPTPVWRDLTSGKDEFLQRVVPNRDKAADAPDLVRPKGGIVVEEMLRQFAEARARTLGFVRETRVPLKAHVREHPFPVFGALNAYQWLLYIPLHHLRHNKQIREVMKDGGFPR